MRGAYAVAAAIVVLFAVACSGSDNGSSTDQATYNTLLERGRENAAGDLANSCGQLDIEHAASTLEEGKASSRVALLELALLDVCLEAGLLPVEADLHFSSYYENAPPR